MKSKLIFVITMLLTSWLYSGTVYEDKNITWSMKFDDSFRISVYVKTTRGSRVVDANKRMIILISGAGWSY